MNIFSFLFSSLINYSYNVSINIIKFTICERMKSLGNHLQSDSFDSFNSVDNDLSVDLNLEKDNLRS